VDALESLSGATALPQSPRHWFGAALLWGMRRSVKAARIDLGVRRVKSIGGFRPCGKGGHARFLAAHDGAD